MNLVDLRPREECAYDVIALGEVMLRLDSGDGRIRAARSFRVWEGGGEYNVARGLRRCFGMRTAIVTALADNEVGRLIEELILQGGVDVSLIRWEPYDGVGRTVRNGLNFTERGFGIRGALGVSDRGHSATSQLQLGEIDWDHLFGTLGARWLHTGGIFAGLSESTRGRRGGDDRGTATRNGRLTRSQLPPQPVGRHWRDGARSGGQPWAGWTR